MNHEMNGILVDWQIRELAEAGMINPFDASLLNPQSLDLRLGKRLIRTSIHGRKEIELTPEQPSFHALPGDFILAETLEVFDLPPNICGQFALKSSMARKGLNHLLAGWCDGGWHGSVLTMEFVNCNPLEDFVFTLGMKCGQMIFQRTEVPEKHYGVVGRYNNDKTVTACKGL